MRRKYHVLDVFSDRPLGGNPLAVVVDCDGLDGQEMQKIAGEFNLSETAFILSPRDPVNTARLRIFTPKIELPFAGHPTVGGAILIAELRAAPLLRTQDLQVVLEEKAGAITCSVSHRKGQSRRAFFALPRLPEKIDARESEARIAAALGLDRADIGFDAHRPAVFSAGVPFTFVPIASLNAIRRASVQKQLFDDTFGGAMPNAVFLYTPETVEPTHQFHARMFAPGFGIAEDPATGSAAAAFAGVMAAFENIPDGSHAFVIEQGYEMGRPSQMVLTLDYEQSHLVSVSVGGAAVIVAEGTLDL